MASNGPPSAPSPPFQTVDTGANPRGIPIPLPRNLTPGPAEGLVLPSENYPGGRSVVVQDIPDNRNTKFIEERVRRDWEYVTVARPVDLHEKVYEVPTTRVVNTFVPKIEVRELVKTIPKDEPTYIETKVEIPHKKVIDKYVEVPVVSGTEIKYVPKIEVRERTVKVTKPEIKWVEKIIEVPQVKEVVRYVESDQNIEQVIRYVPKGSGLTNFQEGSELLPQEGYREEVKAHSEEPYNVEVPQSAQYPGLTGFTPRGVVPLSYRGSAPPSEPQSPRLERMEQLFIPKITRTVEVEKAIPVTVDVPVPFMVPKPVKVPVEVPVLKFRDHFIPVPVRRHVIPKIIFTDEVYEVDCVTEKPVLVVEDYLKPVPVDVKIKLKEKDIKVMPIDPAELSQADIHAMWMRVNADLLDRTRMSGRDVTIFNPDSIEKRDTDAPQQPDFGTLPLHPGHPLMTTYLQAQWLQNPTTLTHNMYTPEFFRMHASALDGYMHPQPHQVNITEEQSVLLGPLPSEQMPSPWNANCSPGQDMPIPEGLMHGENTQREVEAHLAQMPHNA